MVRPLFFHVDEPWAFTEPFVYMYGNELICYPVYRSKTSSMMIRLPKGTWKQLITNKVYEEGLHQITTPLGLPIAFYPRDSEFHDLFFSMASLYDDCNVL